MLKSIRLVVLFLILPIVSFAQVHPEACPVEKGNAAGVSIKDIEKDIEKVGEPFEERRSMVQGEYEEALKKLIQLTLLKQLETKQKIDELNIDELNLDALSLKMAADTLEEKLNELVGKKKAAKLLRKWKMEALGDKGEELIEDFSKKKTVFPSMELNAEVQGEEVIKEVSVQAEENEANLIAQFAVMSEHNTATQNVSANLYLRVLNESRHELSKVAIRPVVEGWLGTKGHPVLTAKAARVRDNMFVVAADISGDYHQQPKTHIWWFDLTQKKLLGSVGPLEQGLDDLLVSDFGEDALKPVVWVYGPAHYDGAEVDRREGFEFSAVTYEGRKVSLSVNNDKTQWLGGALGEQVALDPIQRGLVFTFDNVEYLGHKNGETYKLVKRPVKRP